MSTVPASVPVRRWAARRARQQDQALTTRFPKWLRSATQPTLTQLRLWAFGQQYTVAAINTFLQAADSHLVAHALAGNHVAVTHEVPPNSPARIRIPHVCVGLNVRFIALYQVLRLQQMRFDLGRH